MEQTNSPTSSSANGMLPSNRFSSNDFFNTIDLGITGYFSEQIAKNALKAPPANTAILVGGVVIVAVLLFVLLKK